MNELVLSHYHLSWPDWLTITSPVQNGITDTVCPLSVVSNSCVHRAGSRSAGRPCARVLCVLTRSKRYGVLHLYRVRGQDPTMNEYSSSTCTHGPTNGLLCRTQARTAPRPYVSCDAKVQTAYCRGIGEPGGGESVIHAWTPCW